MTAPRSLGGAFGLLLMLTAPASAWASNLDHASAGRAEALQLVRRIAQGQDVDGSVSRLQFLGQERFAALKLAPLADSPDIDQRRACAEALDQLAVPATAQALEQLAQDEDGATRMAAAEGLGRIHSRNAALVERLLRDPSPGVRRAAALALGQMHRAFLGAALMAAARRESEPEPRLALIQAVGQSGDRRQIRPLERLLQDSSEGAREAAAQSLCQLAAPAGLRYVLGMLGATDRLARRRGLELLEGSSRRQVEPLARPLLADPDPAVAAHAARVLHDAGVEGMVAWLVVASARSNGEAKLAYEDELDAFHLSDEERQAILAKAGRR